MKIAGKKIGLSTQIFAAMLLGAVLGIVIGEPMTKVGFIGTIWLNCIKMIVVPMVLVTIVTGVVSQKDMKTLGRISFRIMAYYVITTLVACAIGILVTSIVKPGAIANFTGLASKEVTGSADITVADFFTGMFSSNITDLCGRQYPSDRSHRNPAGRGDFKDEESGAQGEGYQGHERAQ